jgi:dienelactone hydrolase
MIALVRLSLPIGAALVMVGLALIVLSLLFVPRRPSPAGPQAVGRLDATLHDADGRSLPVTVWYPSTGTAGRVVADGPLAAPAPAPVILYSPGWGGTRDQSSIQVENLASHGFVVVGCDDSSSDPANDPDHGLSLELESDTALKESIERGDRHVRRQANRILAMLQGLESGHIPVLAGRLDLTHVGALGYSVGGPSSLQAGLLDPRIMAILNLDGALLGPPADRIGPQAYLLLSSREALPTEAELNSSIPAVRNDAYLGAIDIPRNRHRIQRPGNAWAVIEPADHGDMADGLFSLRSGRLRRLNSLRAGMNDFIGRVEVAFFRSTLLGNKSALASLAGKDSADVRWMSP